MITLELTDTQAEAVKSALVQRLLVIVAQPVPDLVEADELDDVLVDLTEQINAKCERCDNPADEDGLCAFHLEEAAEMERADLIAKEMDER